MKKYNLLICFSMQLLLYGCPRFGDPIGDATLILVNNSDKTIQYYFGIDSVIANESLKNYPLLFIEKYSKKEIFDWWKESFTTTDYIYLFIFDKIVVDTVPWDTIRLNNMFLARIEFTKQKLDSLKWTLTYP